MRLIRYPTLAFCVSLAACTSRETVETRLGDYLGRVQNATGVVKVEPGSYVSSLLHYPRRRERISPLDESRIGIVGFLSLGDCRLQQLVGARNSGMGRVMPVSQRLLYEHRFIVLGEECLRGIGERPTLAGQLETIIAEKRTNLPKVYWNATFGSDEFEKLFSLASGPLSMDIDESLRSDVIESLRDLSSLGATLGRPDREIDGGWLERYYRLQADRYGGELLYSMDILIFYLEAVAAAIERRLEKGPRCDSGRPGQDVRALRAVFRELYAGGIRSYVGRVHRRARAFLEPIDQLACSLEAEMPSGFRTYCEEQIRLDGDRGVWFRFNRAIDHHTVAWQMLADSCGGS